MIKYKAYFRGKKTRYVKYKFSKSVYAIYKELPEEIKTLATQYFYYQVEQATHSTSPNAVKNWFIEQYNKAPQKLPKVFSGKNNFWYRAKQGSTISEAKFKEIEFYLPQITQCLLHPLWQALSIDDLIDDEAFDLLTNCFNGKFDYCFEINEEFRLGTYQEGCLNKITQLLRIENHFDIDSLALLLILCWHPRRLKGNVCFQLPFSLHEQLLYLSITPSFKYLARTIYSIIDNKLLGLEKKWDSFYYPTNHNHANQILQNSAQSSSKLAIYSFNQTFRNKDGNLYSYTQFLIDIQKYQLLKKLADKSNIHSVLKIKQPLFLKYALYLDLDSVIKVLSDTTSELVDSNLPDVLQQLASRYKRDQNVMRTYML